MSDEAMWKQIDQLREAQSVLAQGMAVIKHEQEIQRQMIAEHNARLLESVAGLNAKLDTIATDFHEARGGIRFGKWLGGIAVGLITVGVAIMGYFKGGN